MSVKAVVFDYGKVISFPPKDRVMTEISALAGVRREVFEPLYHKHRRDYDRGKSDVSGFYRNILAELKLSLDEETIEAMGKLDLESWKRINPETVKLMEEIKKSGLLLGILSNMPHDFLEYARRVFPVFSLPHFSIFSCEAGCIKPEEAIYRKLLSAAGCGAEELVFFDDVAENVGKALELNIKARLWQDCEKARRDLAALGVLPGKPSL